MASASLVTTVILIRHGERNATPTNPDPHLNAAGKARAKSLIHVFGQSGIKASTGPISPARRQRKPSYHPALSH
jgi:broad specificity phosphatase PhoE